jgi:hypothetical protein
MVASGLSEQVCLQLYFATPFVGFTCGLSMAAMMLADAG